MQLDDTDCTGESALHVASRNGHNGCVEVLIKNAQRHTIYARNPDDQTPLHLAVINNHP